jgi:hypothetical protein
VPDYTQDAALLLTGSTSSERGGKQKAEKEKCSRSSGIPVF